MERYESLMDAIKKGDLESVDRLVGFVDLNQPCSRSKVLFLNMASRLGNDAITSILLDHGSDVHCVSTNGYTSLHEVCASSADKRKLRVIAELLIQKGVDINACDQNGVQAIHLASWMQNLPVLELLISYGADVNARRGCPEAHLIEELGDDRHTPLILAATQGHLDICKVLLNCGANVDDQDSSKCTALYWAVVKNHVDIVKILLNYRAKPNIRGVNGKSPLYIANDRGFSQIVDILIEACADSSEIENGKNKIRDRDRGRCDTIEML